MTSLSTTFAATGNGQILHFKRDETFTYTLTGTFVGTLELVRFTDGNGAAAEEIMLTTTTTVSATNHQVLKPGFYGWRCSAYTSGSPVATIADAEGDIVQENIVNESGTALFGIEDDGINFSKDGTLVTATGAELNLLESTNNATTVGALATAPVSGTVAATITRVGPLFKIDFTLTAAQIPVTDAAASGSYGALNLFDLAEGAVTFLGCRQNYTAFAEGAALTGAAGDASFDIGVGTVAIASAADGALAGTDDDIGTEVNITLSGGTGTGTGTNGAQGSHDGTASAGSINLNWSGTAATIDANSTIDVTGTISVVGVFLGDD